MFLLDFIKNFVFFALVLLIFPSCGFWQKSEGETLSQPHFAAEELKSKIPFSTKEPENFQAEIVIDANNQKRKTFIARSGVNYRYDFDFGAKNQISVLHAEKDYTLLPERKIYTEKSGGESAQAAEEIDDFLSAGWLNAGTQKTFERLETENDLTKYRVNLGEGGFSEIVLFVDEKLNFPVKQEFYSIAGAERILTYSVELQNIKIPADARLFAVPEDFRKVSAEEFSAELRKIRK